MRKYVNEQMLNCIKKNRKYPQDVDISKNQYISFGRVGLIAYKLTNKGQYFKYVNYWHDMTADKINETLNAMDWRQEE